MSDAKKLFVLEHGDWDSANYWNLIGPTSCSADQFKELCDSLMPEAGRKAMKLAEPEDGDPYSGDLIGWNDVCEALVILLADHGFDLEERERVVIGYNGSDLFDSHRDTVQEMPSGRSRPASELLGADVFAAIVVQNNLISKRIDEAADVPDEDETNG